MSDDTRLEEAFRAGLQRRADDADTTPDLLGPARAAARGQRRRRFAVTGAVGLAAAALVTAVVVQNAGGSDGPDGTTVLDADEPLPTQWRTEAWHGLQVEVPADWAWGSAPVASAGESLRCGGPDGDVPYVGRPVMASDVCTMAKHFEPTAPYVWLGADVDPGTRDVGNGLVETTVEVEGTTLTVAARSQNLIDHVIDSARGVDGCAASLGAPPSVDSMLMEGMGDVTGARICAYSRVDAEDGTYRLVYGTTLDAAAAERYHAALYDGTRQNDETFCDQQDEMVLVTMEGTDRYGDVAVSQDSVVAPFCGQWSGGPGSVTPMADEVVDTWAVGGLPVTLYSLIGPMG